MAMRGTRYFILSVVTIAIDLLCGAVEVDVEVDTAIQQTVVTDEKDMAR